MLKNKTRFWMWLAAAVFMMACIYWQSGTPYHKQDTKPMLMKRLHLTADSLPPIKFDYDRSTVTTARPYEFIDFVIRKMGHVAEYAVLTFLWLKTWSYVDVRLRYQLLWSVLLPVSYAMADEWHQSLVKERTGHMIDVWGPDLSGVAAAVLIYLLFRAKRLPKRRILIAISVMMVAAGGIGLFSFWNGGQPKQRSVSIPKMAAGKNQAETTQEQAGQLENSISPADKAKLVSILLKKLSSEEIGLFIKLSSDDLSADEKKQAKQIILERCSEEEYNQLAGILAKYGLSQGQEYKEARKELDQR